jgi:hypothetical protein
MKVNEYFTNLDVEAPAWLDALERFYRPWQMAYFRPLSNVISIKRPARREKNTSNMADGRRWRHRVTSLQVLNRQCFFVDKSCRKNAHAFPLCYVNRGIMTLWRLLVSARSTIYHKACSPYLLWCDWVCLLKPHCIRYSHFKVDDVSALEPSSKPPVHIVEDDVTASLHQQRTPWPWLRPGCRDDVTWIC